MGDPVEVVPVTIDENGPPGEVENSVPSPTPTPSVSPESLTLDGIVEAHTATFIGFDPDVHAVGADGKPRLKADGSYALKRGRKAVSAGYALPPKDAAVTGSAPSPGAPLSVVTSSDAAKLSANLVFNGGVLIFGEPLATPNAEEKSGMVLAFKNYYDAKGIPNIPPEFALLIAVGFYVVPRLRHESMKEKVTRWIVGGKRLLGIG